MARPQPTRRRGDRATKPSVLLVANDLSGVGGIQRLSRSLARVVAGTCDLRTCELGVGRSPLQQAQAALTVIGRVARDRPDLLVLAHVGLGPIGLACRVLGVRYVVVAYGMEVWGPRSRVQDVVMSQAAACWPISTFTRSRVAERHPRARVGPVIGGCVDDPRLFAVEPVATPDFRVLTVARAEDAVYKGLAECIEALTPLAETHPVDYRVIGPGYSPSRLRSLLGGREVPAFVTVVGEVDDRGLLEEYRRAAVVALVSRFRSGHRPAGEGLGLVVLEGGAAAVPAVVSSHAAGPETVVDGVTGYVVDPDRPDEIAGAFRSLAEDPERRRRMGGAAREWVAEHHSAEAFARRVEAALNRALR